MHRNLGTAFSLLGAIIGSGMMTGAEVKIYFGSGISAFFSIAIAVIIIAIVFGIFINYCNRNNICSVENLGKHLFGKYCSFFNFFICINSIICAGAMLAGTSQLLNNIFNINSIFCSSIIAVLGSLIAYKGSVYIKYLNLIVIPVIIIFVCALLIFNDAEQIKYQPRNILNSMIFSIYNCALALPLCCSLKIDKKDIKPSVIILAISSFIIISIISIIVGNLDNKSDIPIFECIIMLSPIAAYFYAIVLMSASITTYISAMLTFSKSILKLAMGTLLALIISTFELGNIVVYVYPLSGALCLICLGAIILKYLHKRKEL